MLKRILLFGSFLFATSALMAQIRGYCGTTSEEWREVITERLLENKRMLENGLVQQRNAITYVPVKFHLVADSDGNGRIPEANVYDMLCRMNEDYADQEIQFFVHDGLNYVNNTSTYSNPSSFTGNLRMRSEKVDGCMNIYICQNANTTGGLGTTLGYYDPIDDWLVLRKQEINYSSETITHEIGHYFNLLHPFNGWDHEEYSPNLHGNPVQPISPGGIASENQARTGSCRNCNTAGDFLCGTPPDYNFGFGWSNCDYTLDIRDQCDVTVNPMETNVMGYFLQCSTFEFTDDQKDVIAASVQNRFQNNTLNDNFQPSTTATVGETNLQIPADEEVLNFTNVYFDWEGVDGAEGYIFQIDRFQSFNVFLETYFITDGTSKLTLDLLPDTRYFWRVFPYNSYSTCAGYTPVQIFTTGDSVGTDDIESVSAFTLSPNPITSGNQLQLTLDTAEAFEADIMLYSITGQLVQHQIKRNFHIGTNNMRLSVADVENGTYLVRIQSENGIIHKKVVVAR